MIDRDRHGQRRRGDAPPLLVVPDEPDGILSFEPDDLLQDTEVIDGEIIDDLDDLDPGSDLDLYDEDDYQTRLELVRAIVADVIAHPYAQVTGRHAYYAASGTIVAVRWWRDSRTSARYERMLRAAEATGNNEAMALWEERRSMFLRDRHDRRMELLALPAQAAQAAPRAGIGCAGILLTIGVLLAIAEKNPAEVIAPFQAAGAAIRLAIDVAALLWIPAMLAVPATALGILWAIGRRHATDPTWLATSSDADVDLVIDETTIARALEALRIPQITAYLKDGLPLQFIIPCRIEGRGTRAAIRLPAGVAAEQIATAGRRAQLASGLYRATKETWPSTGDEAGILDLWVADKGALADGAGPYPLLDDGFVDYFKGVPYGKTLRGDPLVAPMAGRNTIVGGMPDQGKSSAARILMAGCALDVTVELRIWVPDANYDFEVFRPRCSRYVMGAEDEAIEQILHDLRELHEEIQIRGDLLVKYQEPEVTRKLASAGVGLHPLVNLLEEAHVAIQHKVYGEEISELLEQITKLGRKRAIHLIVSTQAPTRDSMPRGVTRNCSNGIAFAVGDHIANDALLGQGAYRGGHRATELIPGTDAGTALVKGFTGQRSDMVQAYFLSVRKDHDQVTPLIQRSLEELKRRGNAVPGVDRPRQAVEARDLFDDLDTVLDEHRMKISDLPGLLRDLAPGWAPYRTVNGKQIHKQLRELGVKTVNVHGTHYLDPAELRRALAVAATRDLDEDWS